MASLPQVVVLWIWEPLTCGDVCADPFPDALAHILLLVALHLLISPCIWPNQLTILYEVSQP